MPIRTESGVEGEVDVLHVCWEFPPDVAGGMGVACGALVGALRGRIGVRVVVRGGLCDGYRGGYGQVDVSIKATRGMGLVEFLGQDFDGVRGMMGEVLRFNKEVFAEGYGGERLVHVHDWLTILAGAALKERHGCGLVLHFHSLAVDRVGGATVGGMGEIEQLGIDLADVVVVVSGYAKRILLEHYEVDESMVRVVWNGVDGPMGRIGKLGRVKRVLFLGRMTGQKGVEFMLEVARELVRRRGDVEVFFAGGGDRLEGLRSVVDFLRLGDRVRVLGRVPPEAVRGLMDRMDMICVPSVSEPFGLVGLEAALGGVGVVLSDRCGAAEVLVSATVLQWGDCGGWVEGIDALLSDDERLREQKRRVQKEAASRTWRDAAREILEIYRDFGLLAAADAGESDGGANAKP